MRATFLFLTIIMWLTSGAQNVGIGTNTPTQKLDVAGNINLTGTIMTNGAAGTNGQVLMSTGNGLSWTSLGSQMGFKKCIAFTNAGGGAWTVPAGVTEVMIEVWGAGSGGTVYCGGTSGGYARTVQYVSAGMVFSYLVGKGSEPGLTSNDGGTTQVTFPSGSAIGAFGGGGVSVFNNLTVKGLPKSGSGPTNNSFYMFGNMGEPTITTFAIKNSTTYVQTTQSGAGGAPVGMLNPTAPTGLFVQTENGIVTTQVQSNTAGIPSAGGSSGTPGFAGSNGMVIFWFNN